MNHGANPPRADAILAAGMSPAVKLEVDHFPPIPEVAWRVLELTADLYCGVSELERVVAGDQILTARVLRMANSAFFQRTKEVKSVRQAAVVLGNRKLRGVVVAAALGGALNRTPHGPRLWEHALATGLMAQSLAEMSLTVDADEAFVAGLLHDIGKGLLDSQHMQLFTDAVQEARNCEAVTSVIAERRFLGTDHTEAGSLLAAAWNLPFEVEAVIRGHHEDPAVSDYPELCGLVMAADALCLKLGIGPLHRPNLDLLEILKTAPNLEPHWLHEAEEQMGQRLKENKDLFRIQ